MQPLCSCYTALAVSAIYLVWRTYDASRARRHETLHERVAFMLWTAANELA